jgi:hypothetical protein
MKLMPPLPPFWTNLIASVVTIAYGVRWERHYTAWISVVMNVVFTSLLLGSSDLPNLVYLFLFLYVALGVTVAWKNKKSWYSVFGTKSFGALSLTVSLNAINFLGWAGTLSEWAFRYNDSTIEFLISWLIIAILVHLFGWIFFGRGKS